jgi:hypothetical protein
VALSIVLASRNSIGLDTIRRRVVRDFRNMLWSPPPFLGRSVTQSCRSEKWFITARHLYPDCPAVVLFLHPHNANRPGTIIDKSFGARKFYICATSGGSSPSTPLSHALRPRPHCWHSAWLADKKGMRALSVRQPYAELILRGIKPIEFRSRLQRSGHRKQSQAVSGGWQGRRERSVAIRRIGRPAAVARRAARRSL